MPRLTWVSEGKPRFRLLLGSKKEVAVSDSGFHVAPPLAFHEGRYSSSTGVRYLMPGAVPAIPGVERPAAFTGRAFVRSVDLARGLRIVPSQPGDAGIGGAEVGIA